MLKNQKGVTILILICTITIMVILAGVTIARLKGENGLLTEAQKTEKRVENVEEKEKVILSASAALVVEKGKEISRIDLENELKDYFEKGFYSVLESENEEGTDGYLVTISREDKTIQQYFVEKMGKVTQLPQSPIVTHNLEPKEVVLKGEVVTIQINATPTEGEILQITNPDGSIINASKSLYNVEENGDYMFTVEQTNGGKTIHTVEVSNIRDKTIEDLKAGERVYYDTGVKSIGENGLIECIVLYDTDYNAKESKNYGVQIISANTIDIPITFGSTNLNTSMEQYNNIINSLNLKAESYLNTAYATKARSVGSVPSDKYSQAEELYNSTNKLFPEANNKYKNIDNNYLDDYSQMKKINILQTDNKEKYWLSSRNITNLKGSITFGIRSIDKSGILTNTFLTKFDWFNKNLEKEIKSYTQTNGFRPVFTLKKGVKVKDGNGESIPYRLALD